MSVVLRTTPRFERRSRRFLRRHPDLVDLVDATLGQLAENLDDPPLRLHQLTGRLGGHHAVSIAGAYRVVSVLRRVAGVITLTDLGGHDEVYRTDRYSRIRNLFPMIESRQTTP